MRMMLFSRRILWLVAATMELSENIIWFTKPVVNFVVRPYASSDFFDSSSRAYSFACWGRLKVHHRVVGELRKWVRIERVVSRPI